MQRSTLLKTVIVILACSCRLTAGFFLSSTSPGDLSLSMLQFVFTIGTLLIVALIAYMRPIRLRPLGITMALFLLVQFALNIWAPHAVRWLIVISQTALSLGTIMMGAMLATFPARQARNNLVYAFALAAITLPVFHVLTALDNHTIRQILLVAFACLTLLFLIADRGTTRAFPGVSGEKDSLKGLLSTTFAIFSIKKTDMLMVLISIMFFFGFGSLQVYAEAYALHESSYDLAMGITFVLSSCIAVVCVCGRAKEAFSRCFVLTWLAWLIGFGVILIFPEAATASLIVVTVATTIANLPILATILEVSVNDKISPCFLFPVTMMLLFASHFGGRLATMTLMAHFGPESFSLAAILTAMILIMLAVVIALLFSLSKSAKRAGEDVLASAVVSAGTPAQDAALAHDRSSAALAALAQAHALTDRELEVLRLYCQGRTADFIAAQMFVSRSTVKTYIARAYTKLGVHNKQELLSLLDAQYDEFAR